MSFCKTFGDKVDWILLTTLNYNLESRLVSERDGGDHKRSSPSRLLTSVKIPV